MSTHNVDLNYLNLDYLSGINTGGITSSAANIDIFGSAPVLPNFFANCGNIFPTNTTNFMMPEYSSFGGFDPFGLSTPSFNYMQEFFEAQQMQNTISQMWGSFMELVKNYKMPQFNFNFTPTSSTSSTSSTSASSGYGNHNQKATDLYKGTAADLNKHLKGVLAGKGEKLLELQDKYGISASFMAALVNNESAQGTSNAARTKNNVAGIMSASSNFTKLRTFDSVDDCLEALAKNLRNNYVNKGLVTVSQIHEKYCPIGASNDPNGLNYNWGNNVASLMDKYNNLA